MKNFYVLFLAKLSGFCNACISLKTKEEEEEIFIESFKIVPRINHLLVQRVLFFVPKSIKFSVISTLRFSIIKECH